jgi:hypothetical protein
MKDGAETWAQPSSFEPANFKSKAAIKRALAEDPASMSWLEIGMGANGVTELEGGKYILIVGPDPYRLRNFFGQVRAKGGKLVVS